MINEKNYLRFPMKEEELYHHTRTGITLKVKEQS